jgi:uncharacterized protein YjbI with pentapeptide repeats
MPAARNRVALKRSPVSAHSGHDPWQGLDPRQALVKLTCDFFRGWGQMSDDIDLSEFDDWLVDNFGVIEGDALNEHQMGIVARNVELILDQAKWSAKIDRFQSIVDAHTGEDAKKAFLNHFVIHFDYATFNNSDGSVDFSRLVFPTAVKFYLAKFLGGDVKFGGAKFGGDVNFSWAKFDGTAIFGGAEFGGSVAHFGGAEFGGSVIFGEAKFGGDVDFSSAKFGGMALFNWVKFGGNAFFDRTEFGGGVLFDSAEFGGHTSFDRAVCGDVSLSLRDADFNGHFFLHTVQCGHLILAQSTFHSTATFFIEECSEVPDFRETKFDRLPNLSRLNIKETPRVDRFLLNTDQERVDKWRVLKNLANEAGDHEKAGQFFANEMAAKRGTEITGFWPLLFSGIYYAFSNFGQSYFRPTAWLAFFGTFFATLYYVLLPNALAGWDRVLFSAEYSVRNLIPFLGSLFRFSARPVTEGFATGFEKNLSLINEAHGGIDLFIYLGVVEQLIGGILFFLLLLGLRNVFRMK